MTTVTRNRSTRSIILSQFPADIANRLLRFYDDLADQEADAVMFMARKSYCLYDVMRKAGARSVGSAILSDRLLDSDLIKLEGRRVVLVDDTLFLGSTLERTKRQLGDAGVSDVESRVFCRNTQWHDSRIFDPDHVALDLDDRATRSFCSAAVRALSVAPRAYNVDFPQYRTERSNSRELNELLSSTSWDSVSLTSPHQRVARAGTYTFFPSAPSQERFRYLLGHSLAQAIDVEKVRLFVRMNSQLEIAWLCFVPMVLLRPLSDRDVGCLVDVIAERSGAAEFSASSLPTPRARLRFAQWWLSVVLGQIFYADASAATGRQMRSSVDDSEAGHHFGPWNATGIQQSLAAATTTVEASQALPRMDGPSFCVPQGGNQIPEDLQKAISPKETGSVSLADDVVADFGHLFVSMYDLREVPARTAALATTNRPLFPAVGRLDQGITFHALEKYLTSRHELQGAPQQDVARILSLILDVCNDHGIAVPIVCSDQGTVFRAYRHGEDVKFTDGELDLAYYAVKGFMDAAERDTIPNLTLQKLLVLLIRFGASRGFLEVLHGEGSVSNIVDIQFDLKGAVPKVHTGPRRRVGSEQWLSHYLQKRGVLTRDKPKGPYKLGSPVDGSFLVADAPQQAQELGAMIGLLSRPSGPVEQLSGRDLILLASVEPPRDALAAIEVELQILADQYSDNLRGLLMSSQHETEQSLLEKARKLINSEGYEAVHSGRMKYRAFRLGEHAVLVEDMAQRLASGGGVPALLLANRWRAYWQSVATSKTLEEERREVTPLIDACGSLLWEGAAALILAEISLSQLAAMVNIQGSANFARKGEDKLNEFNAAMGGCGLDIPNTVATINRSLRRADPVPDFRRAVTFSLDTLDDVVSRVPSVLDSGEQVIARRAGLSGRRDYSYVLWYDVLDSTATKAGRRGDDVDLHAAEVSAFRGVINRSLQTLVHVGRNNQTEVYAWNGDVNSTNDEKHIFFSGKTAQSLMTKAFNEIGVALLATPRVRVRVVLCDANFAGASPYRYDGDSEVRGPRFWEHFSRVKKKLREIEEHETTDDGSMITFVGPRLYRSRPSFKHWSVRNASERIITSEAQFLERPTQATTMRGSPKA